jgi:anti-sigma regulatory factor (Ser/Thr protein kinase)
VNEARNPDIPRRLLAVTFTRDRLDAVRHEVRAVSLRHGLDADELSDWVTAVNELMTNAVRHGSGAARLVICANGGLTCEVRDHGRGFAAPQYLDRTERPALSGAGGMGLWLVRQLAQVVSVDSGPAGTTVCIAPAGQPPS